MDGPTFGSLFAGIGGIDLGLDRAGWTGRWQVEWDEYCQHVLAHHWPDIPRYGDITAVDWSTVESVDLIAGGFPCQPVSVAGRRQAQGDDRWLWPEFRRAVAEVRPGYVLVENVPGLLGAHGGLGDVLGDLAALGFDAVWDGVPAAAVGAPHLRDRVWIVAYRAELGRAVADAYDRLFDAVWGVRAGRHEPRHGRSGMADTEVQPVRPGLREGVPSGIGWRRPSDGGSTGDLADTIRLRQPGSGQPLHASRPATEAEGQATDALDGRLGREWATEPDVGRVAHGVPARVDRLRALGNAVVPQVVEVIGRRLMDLIEAESVA